METEEKMKPKKDQKMKKKIKKQKIAKNELKKDRKYLWVVLAFVGVFLLSGVCVIIYDQATKFRIQKHWDDLLIRVENIEDPSKEKEVSLKEFGYYIVTMEQEVQEKALLYDGNNPTSYWNLYIGEENKIGYIRNLAKEYAVDYCIRDSIYECEMVLEDFKSPKEKTEIEKLVKEKMEGYDPDIWEKVGMTSQEWEEILKEKVELDEYHVYLQEQGYFPESLDLSGSYYEDISEKYQVEVNEKLLSQLSFGKITVN